MKSFWDRYFVHREIWEDCHLGFTFQHHNLDTRDLQSVTALLVDHFIPMPIGGGTRLNSLKPSCLHLVSNDDGISLTENMLNVALNYSSNYEMPNAEPNSVVAAFFAEFRNPLVYSNTLIDSDHFYPTTNHTVDRLICCVDEHQLGCILTCEDE